MSSQIPPDPYFSGINYNPGFFTSITDYLTLAIANSKYLKLIGGTLGGFLGILRTPRLALDVNGKAVINDNTSGTPQNAELGGTGTRIILKEGTAIQTPFALGVVLDTLWYGTSSIGSHMFYTGTSQRMFIDNNGSVGIGTSSATSANTKLSIRGSSSGYSQPLVNITQTGAWDGNYALQVTGYTNLGGFRINASDGGNSIFQTLANTDMGIAQNPTVGNTGNLSLTTHGTGKILFYTNGANLRMIINDSGSVGIGFSSTSTFSTPNTKLFVSSGISTPATTYPMRIAAGASSDSGANATLLGLNTEANANGWSKCAIGHIRTSTYDRGAIGFFTRDTADDVSCDMTNERMRINSVGKVGIGTNNPENIFQVGDGGKLRISNGSNDYTQIGVKDTTDTNNTRIVISGHQRSGNSGNIDYVCTTATGAHKLWLDNSTAVADIDTSDFTVYNSITTINANYYTDGEYISYSTKTNVSGTSKSGYFITNEYFFNSFVNIGVSHNSTFYSYWHGHYGTNNSTGVSYISVVSYANMTFEAFTEQTTFKSWIFVVPTVSFNTADQLRVKFYG